MSPIGRCSRYTVHFSILDFVASFGIEPGRLIENGKGTFVTHDQNLIIIFSVGGQTRKGRFYPFGKFIDYLGIVIGFSAIFPIINSSHSYCFLGGRLEYPIGKINLMRAQFGQKSVRILSVHSPIDLSFQ